MKKTLTALTLGLAAAVSAPALAAPETYNIDGTHTYPRVE
jgi:polyisoprenoid-binding protein YceI